jgi:hypothetical protein
VLDPARVRKLAGELGSDEALIEKDWHVVRAISVIAAADHAGVMPVFSGGTSLSKAWGLIKRFSEDIDFKVPLSPEAGRAKRSTYRKRILAVLADAGFALIGEPLRGNNNHFFSADLLYASAFTVAEAFRPHIKIEMTFEAPALPAILRPIRSMIAEAEAEPPEVAAFPSVDPVETAADKLSALAWRVCTRDRGSPRDDPRIVRHVHDLAALEPIVDAAPALAGLVRQVVMADADRGGGGAPRDLVERFALMLERLRTDRLWAKEYGDFVRDTSFGRQDELIGFADALAACERLVAKIGAPRDDGEG